MQLGGAQSVQQVASVAVGEQRKELLRGHL